MLFSYAFLPCDKNVTDFTLLRASYPPFPLLRHDVEKNESFGNGKELRAGRFTRSARVIVP